MNLLQSIQNWLEGDEREFTPVFYYYHQKLLRFSEKFMADRQHAEELVMNVLLKVWKARGAISDTASFNAYIYKAMRNEIVSFFRVRMHEFVPLHAMIWEPVIESAYHYNALTRQYRASVNRLSRRRREIFLMSTEQGMTYSQIAGRLGISVHTVQKHASVAIQTIRDELRLHKDFTASATGLITFYMLLNGSMLN